MQDKMLSCKGILILLGGLLSGNTLEHAVTGNMERDMCCCYRETGFVSKGFLETGGKHNTSKQGPCFWPVS